MALRKSKSPTHFRIQQSQPVLFLNFFRLTIFLFLLFPFANSISFNLSNFQTNDKNIIYQGDAFASNGVIQLTKNQEDKSLTSSAGRASYAYPIYLWDNKTGNLTDFDTHFTFNVTSTNLQDVGDGLTFFLSPYNAKIPINSYGGFLGLFTNSTALNHTNNQIVAIEFDTYKNSWDPSGYHVGIDVNSIQSAAYQTVDDLLANDYNTGAIEVTANALVNYNSSTKNLSLYLTFDKNPAFQGIYTLSYVVDLRKVLPPMVSVGFSAATGLQTVEINNIVSWTFSSTLEGPQNSTGHKTKPRFVVVGLAVIGALSCGVGLFWFMKCKKIVLRGNNDMGHDDSTDDEDFEKGTGPRRFTFCELSHASNNFSEEGKLGQGGFGGVYKGVLSDTQEEIAVKRISKGSKQGKKEYKSEVKIISRLRHRNLVQLLGWCHEQGELLLVYELMPNGSLDKHLFGGKSKLTWTVRYKIAIGLASALLYLHEEWEQCVVHRDIKSSNIMLDSNYNAKLGDFGLARLVDHELGSETTVVAGTMGYLAPECFSTGKASKESDVYSFGVVALEIACGRKPVEVNRDPGQVKLQEWVWSLYGKGQLFEAVDKNLTMEYDEYQVERLMVVGLWCCHPDVNFRPSIRQAINILSSEDSLPVLPSQMPVPMYISPSMGMSSCTSSIPTTDSDKDMTQCSSSSNTRRSHSALSVESSKAPLQLQEDKFFHLKEGRLSYVIDQ